MWNQHLQSIIIDVFSDLMVIKSGKLYLKLQIAQSLVENIAFQVLWNQSMAFIYSLNKVEFFSCLKFHVCCILTLRKHFFYFWKVIREFFMNTGVTPSMKYMASAFQEETLKCLVEVKHGKSCFFWHVLYAKLDKCLGIFIGASCVKMAEISTDWNPYVFFSKRSCNNLNVVDCFEYSSSGKKRQCKVKSCEPLLCTHQVEFRTSLEEQSNRLWISTNISACLGTIEELYWSPFFFSFLLG